MKNYYKNKNSIFILLILLSFISLYITNNFSKNYINIIHFIYYPFGKIVFYINKKIDDIKIYFNSLESISNENFRLKKDIEKYNLLLQDYEEVIKENNRIRKLLNLRIKDKKIIKLGNIIGKSPDMWHKELISDIGKDENIEINNIAISYNGLIGRVKEVTNKNSKIQTINDPSVWVSVQNNRSRSICMLKSETNNKAKLYYLSEKSDFKVNDIIITSGLGGLYPKGIPVGIVSRVNKVSGDIIPEVYVDLLNDFSNIEEVIILK